MLEELSKNDTLWRQIAFNITGCKSKADDLVNDMYLKLHLSNKSYKNINKWYVVRVLRNLYIDDCRKTKPLHLKEDIYLLEEEEPKERLELRKLINTALDELNIFDSEILLHTRERSYTKNAEYLNINRSTIFSMQEVALIKLQNTETIKKYRDAKKE